MNSTPPYPSIKFVNTPTRLTRTCVRAFTIAELLVAILILVVLAALIVPALLRANDSAKSAKCVSNLRKIGVAAQQFANDNNGRILTWGGNLFEPFSPRWQQGLAPILGNTGREAQWTPSTLKRIYDQLACPCIPQAYHWPPGASKSNSSITYAANSFSNPGWGWPEVLRQSIEKPASTIYLVDGHATFATSPGQDIVDPGWPPQSIAFTPTTSVFFPHQGRCNALFLDGHVESFLKVIPAKYIRP